MGGPLGKSLGQNSPGLHSLEKATPPTDGGKPPVNQGKAERSGRPDPTNHSGVEKTRRKTCQEPEGNFPTDLRKIQEIRERHVSRPAPSKNSRGTNNRTKKAQSRSCEKEKNLPRGKHEGRETPVKMHEEAKRLPRVCYRNCRGGIKGAKGGKGGESVSKACGERGKQRKEYLGSIKGPQTKAHGRAKKG